MAENPTAAIDSMLEAEKNSGTDTIYPLTLGRYALLELVKSPFIDKSTKFSTMSLIPTFYIMTHDTKDLHGYTSKNVDELETVAFDWAETKMVSDTTTLVNELLEKFNLVVKVKPDIAEDSKKKDLQLTDGQQA